MSKKIIALVPAAGIGARAKRQTTAALLKPDLPKQYELVNGLPMLRLSVMAMLADPRIDYVRVIVSPTDTWVNDALAGLERTSWHPVGGATRAETVRNGLRELALSNDHWVAVHDAARPGLPASALARLIDTCLDHDQGGLLALPVPDTVKKSTEDGLNQVEKTVPRDNLWLAQTPQMYKADQLLQALEQAEQEQWLVTDESSAMEQAGYRSLLVLGAPQNFKVTWPGDFQILEKWL